MLLYIQIRIFKFDSGFLFFPTTKLPFYAGLTLYAKVYFHLHFIEIAGPRKALTIGS